MNFAGFTRPVWSWLTSADNGLTFLGMPVGVPRRSGAATATTMRDFAASVPWKVANRHWNLLGSHDTPRIRTVTGDRRPRAGPHRSGIADGLPGRTEDLLAGCGSSAI